MVARLDLPAVPQELRGRDLLAPAVVVRGLQMTAVEYPAEVRVAAVAEVRGREQEFPGKLRARAAAAVPGVDIRQTVPPVVVVVVDGVRSATPAILVMPVLRQRHHLLIVCRLRPVAHIPLLLAPPEGKLTFLGIRNDSQEKITRYSTQTRRGKFYLVA